MEKIYIYNINFIQDLYPFGSNGVSIKNVLKDYFNLEPCFIVDNEYSKYNSKIIDKNVLGDVWQKDMFIITLENVSVNAQIVKEFSGFVPFTNIINLKKPDPDIKGFRLYDFLPMHKLEIKALDKIKVRIMYSEAMC